VLRIEISVLAKAITKNDTIIIVSKALVINKILLNIALKFTNSPLSAINATNT
jgi:ribosomal protein L18E